MKITDLASDPALVPENLTPFERGMRTNYILIRLRRSQALRGTNNRGEIADSKVTAAKTLLAQELTAAGAQVTWVAGEMATYQTAGKLVSLEQDDVDQSLLAGYFSDKLIPGTEPPKLKARRKTQVLAITWRATASDPQLLQRGGDLLKLVDRRLHVAERMLYYVGQGASWLAADGKKRMFEYPFGSPNRVGIAARDLWSGPGGTRNYSFVLAPGTSPSQAVGALFTPQTDGNDRNLFFCDQVLMSLHIEALMVAEKNARGDHTWFNTTVSNQPAGWLRVDDPWRKNFAYLGSEDEPRWFEHGQVDIADLQVGDHLIVFNHPLFSALVPENEWQLENSLVVQVDPKLLVQGHGTAPKSLADMTKHLLEQCNNELRKARDKVEAEVAQPTVNAADPYPSIIVGGGPGARCSAVRRVPPAQSGYAPQQQKADWWLRWTPLGGREGEYELYRNITDPDWQTRREIIKQNQKVDIVVEDTAQPIRGGFFFPLWEPGLKKPGGAIVPVRDSQGKISGIHPVEVSVDMVSPEGFYFPLPPSPPGPPPQRPPPPRRGVTAAIRPKV